MRKIDRVAAFGDLPERSRLFLQLLSVIAVPIVLEPIVMME
jgi:hypothetical protein